MKSSEIRQAFFDYFTSKGHQYVDSSSLVPTNDPTLLFSNAGMVQFKDVFLGQEIRPYSRAVSSQRCVRAGGKHNDLENVGYTARHHTFFEMLGNFSFGDYFKREAIQFAWEFLTVNLKLPAEKLWITVYQDDEEAASIWLNEIGASAERFSRCGEKDNFWSMGDTGPCGPCTEIFYDHGSNIAGGPPGSPDADGDRYIEIWNLVFMQFNRDKEGNLHPLPKPSVDTGMGLERIAAVVQGVHTNYEIDSFQQLIKAILLLAPQENETHPSLNVIADHIRACSFLITDGVIPGNEGRGYVLRRIIRRAVRHGNKLNLPTPFFNRLVDTLVAVMGDAYPELMTHQNHIKRILEQEENQFNRTLEQGLKLLHEHIENLTEKEIPGDVAFKLYDTYGFPLDLTQDIAREHNVQVDVKGFNQYMQQQRKLSQSASQFNTDYSLSAQVSETSVFHGYEKSSLKSRVLSILQENQRIDSLATNEKVAIILDNSPFYAESGGQVGDKGLLTSQNGKFCVEDTQRVGQAIVHYGYLLEGKLHVNDEVDASIDCARRQAIRINHTATHLLHAALKKIVGDHVQQKGSLVDAERARFDFSHFEPLTAQQITAAEFIVNEQIRTNNPVITELMDLDEAKKIGAMALFGEKYSEKVRVLSLGDFSKELCGGTHAARTGDIGLFKIIAEYGIASGVRRIEIVTGNYALNWIDQQLANLQEIAQKLKSSPANVNEKLTQILMDAKQKEKELTLIQAQLTSKSSNDLLDDLQQRGAINLLVKEIPHSNMQALRTMMDQIKSKVNNIVIVLYTLENDKINVIASVSKSLINSAVVPAPTIVNYLCGKGGGRDDMAQGGGVAPANLKQLIQDIENVIFIK